MMVCEIAFVIFNAARAIFSFVFLYNLQHYYYISLSQDGHLVLRRQSCMDLPDYSSNKQ
jgi:hypothetical protein